METDYVKTHLQWNLINMQISLMKHLILKIGILPSCLLKDVDFYEIIY